MADIRRGKTPYFTRSTIEKGGREASLAGSRQFTDDAGSRSTGYGVVSDFEYVIFQNAK